jgi:amidophosphoribosyltransferase
VGQVNGSYVLASETCALDLIGAKYLREVEPGEIVFIDATGIKSIMPYPKHKPAHCIFEMIYFARPDSLVFSGSVYEARKDLGRNLAKEHPVNCDMVLPVPDSGNCAALGFSERSKIPFELGIVRNHYIGRTFIQPSQKVRDFSVKIKLNPVKGLLKGKKVVIVEDSIVRGTTSRVRVKTLKDAGAAEVHMRVSCPPIKYPCLYGIDFPTKEELIASTKSVEEIRQFLGLNSLGYLSVEGMLSSMPIDGKNFCAACFTGDYPVEFEKGMGKYTFEKLIA